MNTEKELCQSDQGPFINTTPESALVVATWKTALKASLGWIATAALGSTLLTMWVQARFERPEG